MSASSEQRTAPLISIVCAVRNAAASIDALLDSYVCQRDARSELVVVDALSSDGTTEILRARSDAHDCLIVERDNGIYDAWNKGVRAARGMYVCFVGADDRLARGALNALCASVESNDEVDLIYGFNVQTVKGVPIALQGRPFVRGRMQINQMLAHVMSAHRRQWIIEAGFFNTRFKASGDYEFLLRSRLSMRVRQVNTVLAYVEDGGISRRAFWPFYETRDARVMTGMSPFFANLLLLRAFVGRTARLLLGMRI